MTPPPASRIVALDVARGIAILGTLATNIWIFAWSAGESTSVLMEALVGGQYFNVFDDITRGGEEAAVSAVLHLVTDGKFLGLLTIMFGVGLEVQRQSAARKGARWPGGYYWRAGLLALEGLLNYIFVFEYDVLMGYGLTALAVAPILARNERVQKVAAWSALAVHAVVIVFFDIALVLAGGLGTVSTQFYGGTDSYWQMVHTRVTDVVDGRFEIPILVVMGVFMFITGARLYRHGLFQPDGTHLRRVLLRIGLGIGLPLDLGLRLFATSSAAMTTRYLTSALVAFGILALIAEFYVRRGNRVGRVGAAMTAVGRMALSCYILQNILASVIFYDFGLGVARAISGPGQTYWVIAIYLGICALLVVFSILWLRRFSRGPVEIVMHRLYRSRYKRQG